MLTAVEVFTPQGQNLLLPLQDTSNGFIIEEIEGLDPVKATIVSSKFGTLDGEQYQASYREKRNIVVKLGLETGAGDISVSELRGQLYDFFMPKSQVLLRFYVDGVAFVDIQGRVESFEAPLFTDTPEATLSVLCFNPDFFTPDSIVVDGETVEDTTNMDVLYTGSVETGFVLSLTVAEALSELFLYNTTPSGDVQMLEFVAPLLTGDILKISTISGNKYARLTRSGSESSILYGVSPASNWVNLYKGTNRIRVLAEGGPHDYTIEYVTKYGGL